MKANPRKLGVIALVAATYCMVAGGPFGLEDIVGKSGYLRAIIILGITALVWALPTTLMVGELSSALPKEGGFYAWVRFGMGDFWGFQEGWLSYVGSVFDMAIYPTLFVAYIGHLWPQLNQGHLPVLIGVAMIVACTLWNLRGAHVVGLGSIGSTILLLSPFAVVSLLALFHHGVSSPATTASNIKLDILGGILIAMWNFMGWDNSSTIAEEVENPKRTYPLAMFLAIALVTLTYVLPIFAIWKSGLDLSVWDTGGWVDIGQAIGGNWFAAAIMLAGAVATMSTFLALTLSLSRLPSAMAKDGFLPKIFARENSAGVPWVAVVVSSAVYASALCLSFEKILTLDVLLTSLSILLEFVALVVLRVRQPNLPRPFRVWGGTTGAILCGLGPLVLIVIAIIKAGDEQIGPISALHLGIALILLGAPVYFVSKYFRNKSRPKKYIKPRAWFPND